MARPGVAVPLAAATFVLLAVCLFLNVFGLPELDYWHWKQSRGTYSNAQIPFGYEEHGDDQQYLLGVGKADITGPVVEINLMGYADPKQVGSGLRQRLYSRAFIVGDLEEPADRFVYLVLDTQSGDTAIRDGILKGLRALGPDYAMYGQQNVAVTGTHSHSGPGAWLNYLLPQITSKGFDKQSYHAIVSGALLSVQRAHESLTPGRLSIGTTEILDANINRSLYAYLANPLSERQRYHHSVDKTLTLLRFQRASDDKDIGILTWFPVHGTSMLGNNTLITGDNKGVAAALFEAHVSNNSSNSNVAAASSFIAGFSQSNVGDTSPNILGAYCESGPDAGKECNFEDSTCGGRNEPCHGRGPFFGLDDAGTKSCFEIGRRQFAGARELYDAMVSDPGRHATSVRGRAVRAFHTFVDLGNYTFPHPNGSVVSTCPAALGYSFAAGTTDGPGAFDFRQNNSGEGNASPVWAVVRNFLHAPSEEQKACQAPKPILLDVGNTKKPYDWAPNIVDVQALRVGQVLIIVSPGEATTMAGRRWREAVKKAAVEMKLASQRTRRDCGDGDKEVEPIVLVGGPANTYTHYITTEQEYAIQRYEGASTLHGPHTLNAHINLTLSHLHFLADDSPASDHPHAEVSPQINTNRSLSFIGGVVLDRPGLFKKFGDVLKEPEKRYGRGDVAEVTFVGANPRNNLRLEQTYVAVEKMQETGAWVAVRDDGDWDLVFEWKRTSTALGTSEVRVSWEIGVGEGEGGVDGGVYRFRYWGDAKSLGGKITGFEGVSGGFEVV